MGLSHYDVCVHFAKREAKRDKKASNVFTGRENTCIYSYGSHFCMAYADDERKIIVVNGDRYGVTTSRHQSELRGALQTYLPSGYQQIVIPFDILRSAGVELETVTPIAVESDYEDAYCKTHDVHFYGNSVDTAYMEMNLHKSINNYECETQYRHRLGGSIFKAKTRKAYSHRQRWEYFLSGFDETHNSRTDGFFISQLPHAVRTVAEGYESLKPKMVRDAIAAGLDVKRQGDAFAIPVFDLNVRKMVRQKATMIEHTGYRYEDAQGNTYPNWHRNSEWKYGALPKTLDIPTFGMVNGRPNSHGANDVAIDRYGHIFARGNLIHRPPFRQPEHKPIKLGKVWHRIVFNTAKASWQSQTGRVD